MNHASQPRQPSPVGALREAPRAADVAAIGRLVRETGYFSESEVEVAQELVQERLHKGEASGYFFLFLEQDDTMAGYCCFGPIACTVGSYDLYWIAVDRRRQGQGLGQWLLHQSERRIAAQGGRHVYIETSGRAQYAGTRAFYERCGYEVAAVLEDFYAAGDAKVIYRKCLSSSCV
jgi:ribosomal protein S18 acetylase RimI-like enzyme